MSTIANISGGGSNDEAEAVLDEDSIINFKDKTKIFLKTHWRGLVCILTPVVLVAVLIPFPPAKYQWCAYTLMLMAVYWVVECIPLAITSFLPLLIFPLSGIMDTVTTCKCYMNDTIMMFLGSLILAYAVEQSGLHKRLALCAIRAIGYSHSKLLFAMSYTTMFISMWITNTAATTMMVPINFAMLKVFEDQDLISIFVTDNNGDLIASDITTCYFCSSTFSATVGGIGTLVGTGTNLVFKGLFSKTYPDAPEYLSFPKFSAFSVLYMLLMETAIYLAMMIMYIGFLRPKSNAAKQAKITEEGLQAAKTAVNENWKRIGKLSMWEFLVIILFSTAMFLFFCRSPLIFKGWADKITESYGITGTKFIKDSTPIMLVGFALMLLPINMDILKNFTAKENDELPDKPIRALLDWKIMDDVMPYAFMFLLGGGFALSTAAQKEYSDLNGRIGDMLEIFQDLPNYFVILIIIVFTILITNFAANVAVANVMVPIVMQMATKIKINPLWYNITAGFSASYCFCLPVGTPGNLIVQSAASIPTGKMIKAGIAPTLTTIVISWFCLSFWAPVIWPDISQRPAWMEP